MKLSLEDWFPILPFCWLDLYSMPVSLWPLILLWSGGHKLRTDSKSYRKVRAIAKGRQKRGGDIWNDEMVGGGFEGGSVNWSNHHLTDLWMCMEFAVGERLCVCGEEWREKGTMVSRVDRDVRFALVILGCLGIARGQHGGSWEQRCDRADHPNHTGGGSGGMDKSKRQNVIFGKLSKSPWKLAWRSF